MKKLFLPLLLVFVLLSSFNILYAQATITNDPNNKCPRVNVYDVQAQRVKSISISTINPTGSPTNPTTPNPYSDLACPAKISDLQTLFLRLLVIANSIAGMVLLFVIGKAAIMRMTSRGSADIVKKSTAMITNAIVGLVIVIIAYTILIFIGTRLLPGDICPGYTYSFLDSGRVLFFFNQSDISPVFKEDINGNITCINYNP